MKKLFCGVALSLGVVFSTPVALAETIGLSAQQVYELKTQGEQAILFVDVRDPVETMFVGSTDVVDANIPFMLVDRYQMDEEKGVFRMYKNPHFVNEIKRA